MCVCAAALTHAMSPLNHTLHPVCLFSGLQRGAEAESGAEEAEAGFGLQEHRVNQEGCCLRPMNITISRVSQHQDCLKLVYYLVKCNIDVLAFLHLRNWG